MKSRIVTVRLDEETFKKLSEISEREKISKGSILKKALHLYFKLENKNKIKIEDITELYDKVNELDKKYYKVINRLNIISRQLENLQNRVLKHGKR